MKTAEVVAMEGCPLPAGVRLHVSCHMEDPEIFVKENDIQVKPGIRYLEGLGRAFGEIEISSLLRYFHKENSFGWQSCAHPMLCNYSSTVM